MIAVKRLPIEVDNLFTFQDVAHFQFPHVAEHTHLEELVKKLLFSHPALYFTTTLHYYA